MVDTTLSLTNQLCTVRGSIALSIRATEAVAYIHSEEHIQRKSMARNRISEIGEVRVYV